MKKVLLILGVVLALAAGGIFVYISTIDWNQHKDKIAAQFNDITGKRVVFEGPVSFSLLPSPYLTATDIKVYNPEGEESDKPLATIKRLIANLALGPLLQGNFEVKMMSLQEPEVWFKVMLADAADRISEKQSGKCGNFARQRNAGKSQS